MKRNTITREEAMAALSYDKETGLFSWNTSPANNVMIGSVAGGCNGKGYLRVCINRKSFVLHRLAWLIVHGYLPEGDIDHINRDRKDNRIINLREATRSQNNSNRGVSKKSSSGYKGVRKRWDGKAWTAEISVNNRNRYLGSFPDLESAYAAYLNAAKEIQGDFVGVS